MAKKQYVIITRCVSSLTTWRYVNSLTESISGINDFLFQSVHRIFCQLFVCFYVLFWVSFLRRYLLFYVYTTDYFSFKFKQFSPNVVCSVCSHISEFLFTPKYNFRSSERRLGTSRWLLYCRWPALASKTVNRPVECLRPAQPFGSSKLSHSQAGIGKLAVHSVCRAASHNPRILTTTTTTTTTIIIIIMQFRGQTSCPRT